MKTEDRIKELQKQGYSRAQATIMCYAMQNKMQMGGNKQYAQQANILPFESSLEGNPIFSGYNMQPNNFDPNAPTSESLALYNNQQSNPSQNTISIDGEPQENNQGNQYLSEEQLATNKQKYNPNRRTQNINEVNILNPFSGVSLDNSLYYAGRGFGEKDPWKAGIGTGLSVLKGGREFLSGFATGKEDKRVEDEYRKKLFEQNRNYNYVQGTGSQSYYTGQNAQQGGEIKLKNSDMLTGQYLADEGVANTNMEQGEFVARANSGNVQQVIGEKHVKNGKEAEGVNVNLEQGDKALSNTKILPLGAKNAKELRDRYNITVKAKDTFATAQKKVDNKIGYKKETDKLADLIEKFGANEKIKDTTTKDFNKNVLAEKMTAMKSKIDALNEVRGMVFEDLFQRQEMLPKKGNSGDLFTDSGKLVTEKNQGVAQQGGEQQDQVSQIIQAYAQASGQDPQAITEQLQQMQPEEQQQALQQMVQELQGGQEQGETNQSMQEENQEMNGTAQQGGLMEIARKHGISPQRAQELVNLAMQQGGELQGQQEEQMEGQNSNPQEEGQENQILQMVAQALQQGQSPDQVITALIQQGVPHEVAMQAIQQVMQQMQGQSQEQTAQQGGKIYAQQAVNESRAQAEKRKAEKLTDKEQEIREFENLLYTNKYGQIEAPLQHTLVGDKNLYDLSEQDYQYRIEEYYKVIPHLAKKYFPKKDGKYTVIDKETTKQFQQDYDKYIDKVFTKFKGTYTPEQLDKAKSFIKFQPALKEDASARLYDSKMGLFTSSRSGVKAPILPQKRIVELNSKGIYHLSSALASNELTPDEKKLLQGEADKYDDYYILPIEETATKPELPQVGEQQEVDVQRNIKNYMPQFPVDLRLPPSALQPLNKPYVPFARLEPIKATPEPMLAEQERLRQTDLERINQTGLAPQQVEALSSAGLASSQLAANDAIGKVENFNAQNQFQTDQFNLGNATKEALTNAQFTQKYQDQMLGSMANTERDWGNFYTEGNLQNRVNYNNVENANYLNAKNEQYAVVSGQGVIFKNNRAVNNPLSMPTTKEDWDKKTADEQWKILNGLNDNFNKQSKAMKKYQSQTSTV